MSRFLDVYLRATICHRMMSMMYVNWWSMEEDHHISSNSHVMSTLVICTEISLHGRAYHADWFCNTWLRRQCKWICLNDAYKDCVLTSGFILVHYLLYFGGKRFFSLCNFFLGSCNKRDSSCNRCTFCVIVIWNIQ